MDFASVLGDMQSSTLDRDRHIETPFYQTLNTDHSLTGDGVFIQVHEHIANEYPTHSLNTSDPYQGSVPHSSSQNSLVQNEEPGLRFPDNSLYDDSLIWCESCQISKEEECSEHPVTIMRDKSIPSFARLTLPVNFTLNLDMYGDYAVVCRKSVRSHTRFGPLLGKKISCIEEDGNKGHFYKIFNSKDEYFYMDTSDEAVSNWMMFVPQAKSYSEQNLIAYQHKGAIFFCSIKKILPGDELKFGFSKVYAELLGLPTLKQLNTNGSPEKNVIIKDGFPCDTCSLVFIEFEELEKHACPEDNEKESGRGRRTRNRRKGKPQKLGMSPPKMASLSEQDDKNPKVVSRPKKLSSIQKVQCNSCNLVFNTRRRLALHMYLHTGEHPYKCETMSCKKSFNSKFKLDRHRLIHGSRDFTCSHCGKSFARKDNLQAHAIIHDNNRESFKCTFTSCQKEYNSKASFKVHVAIHQAKEGARECPLCHMVYNDSDLLINHIKVHAGSQQIKGIMEKKHKCTVCDKRFFARKDKQRHMLTHTKEKQFECHLCQMKFGRRDHLKRHLNKIHPNGEKEVQSKSSRMSKKADQLSDMTASDLTKSIQQLLSDSNINLDHPSTSLGDFCLTSGSAVHISSFSNSSVGQKLIIPQASHEIVSFQNCQNLSGTANAPQRISINGLQGAISSNNQTDQPYNSYIKSLQWQPILCSDGTSKYLYSSTSDAVRLGQPTMILLPEGHAQIGGLEQAHRTGSSILENGHVLTTETLCPDYASSDGLKVLNAFTPIFLNQDGTASDNEFIPVVYQQTYNQNSQS